MSRSRDLGSAANIIASPSSTYNGYSYIVDTTQPGNVNYSGNVVAGKNFLLNGGFDYWQRGLTFSSNTFTADRWFQYGSDSVTRQSFTAASPEIPNGVYYLRYQATQNGAYHYIQQNIENAHNDLSGKTVTISFWARSNTGSNGTLSVLTALTNDTQLYSANFNTTTSWAKYYATFNIATLNYAASYRYMRMGGIGDGGGVDLAQVQYEIGSAPTQFSRAGGTLGGERRECERHYIRFVDGGAAYMTYFLGTAGTTTQVAAHLTFPTTMRAAPTIGTDYSLPSSFWLNDGTTQINLASSSAITLVRSNQNAAQIAVNSASSLTLYRPYLLQSQNSAGSYIGFSADL